MYNTVKTAVWYGELRTSRGNAIVIHDKQFPEASAGRIYLYNAERDSIIEYAEEIVKNNLHDLDKKAVKAVEETYGSAWNATRSQFMQKHDGWVEANTTKHTPLIKISKPTPRPKPDEDADDKDINSEVDLEMGSESQDREFADGWSGGLEE
ncbi:conserved hypothetical protein [Shewanella sediminis HAW-EB3]|uniref:Uncharacterized protein n=1 Tax=Shewanella sediminis (strain HAW-EB3) TaxID=425104 RepID=A8G0K3_SHESH|nr:hypothetical protein [Shewanella sediminis]ABV38626.1 conserved hypothetical protein [Shewanella sediminis HAW-EB3]